MPQKVTVFISYAHLDEEYKDRLNAHLSALRRSEMIALWQDRQILPGSEWDKAIKDELNAADIILLLVSADFINSGYIWDNELAIALERHGKGEARVIPIICRPCDWQDMPFAKLQALPTNARPITTFANPDEAYTEIARSLRLLIEHLYQNKP